MNIFDIIESGGLESLKKLIESGTNTDIEVRDKYGDTPLIIASRYGHLEIAKFLVGFGANIEATDLYGLTPLIDASWGGHLEIVKLLIESGANYEGLLEFLEKEDEVDKREKLEKIILEVADTKVKFIN